MKTKLFLIVGIIAGYIFLSNYSFSSNTDDPKCKCESCKCVDCKCGANGCCTNPEQCKAKCDSMKNSGGKCCDENCKSKCTEMKDKDCSNMKDAGCTKMKDGGCPGMQKTDCKKDEKCKDKKDCMKKKEEGSSQGRGEMDTIKTGAGKCPVSGEDIAEGQGVTYKYLGKDYTFCCEKCVAKFKAEPMNYIKGDVNCPVMGEAASKETFSVYNGVKYYFCCSPCVKKFEKDPEKYLEKYNK